jgi:hypothetical protein
MSCRWLLVMACIDRWISSSANARFRRFSSVTMARRIAIIIFGIWLILPIHTLIFSNITPPGNIACSITNAGVALYHRFYTIIMGGALPSVITLIFSLFLWKNLQLRRQRRIIISNNEQERRRKIRDQQIIFMLLTQVVIFVISAIPFMSYNTYDTITNTISNKSVDRKAIEAFVKTLTELLVYLIALSFYSNTLVSRTFRKELIMLFRLIISCGQQQRRHRRVNPASVASTRNNTWQLMTTMRTAQRAMPEVD